MNSNSIKGLITQIIDRTIPEVFSPELRISRLDLVNFCWMLKEAGADLIELDSASLKRMEKLPAGIDFIYRIKDLSDVGLCTEYFLKNCILDIHAFNVHELFQCLSDKKAKIYIELQINDIKELYRFMENRLTGDEVSGTVHLPQPDGTTHSNLKSTDVYSSICKLNNSEKIKGIRIKGLDSVLSAGWLDIIKRIRTDFHWTVDICPGNTFCQATALAMEAVLAGSDFVTATFTGYGRVRGYAPLEEVLAARKVFREENSRSNLKGLPALTRYFTKFTGKNIPGSKPVIGKDIFKYESGIHADGIQKDPATYEPFAPESVGQTRTLTIGKHSGKRALHKKLSEFGVQVRADEASFLLDLIRGRSVLIKRSLTDQEIWQVYIENFMKV